MLRKRTTMICSICLNRNYQLFKSEITKRLEISKYCSLCNKHTLHKETR